ncbi:MULTISPECIES: hypothetical protein [Streptomyces]|uniref:Uncharacterized protein n=1 Tax=Streptomyces kaempferi TaxID=333725 RepID=A0ABW3XR73_9ACTN|nr:hypothetical protein [Streptomyces sp. NBC_01462]
MSDRVGEQFTGRTARGVVRRLGFGAASGEPGRAPDTADPVRPPPPPRAPARLPDTDAKIAKQ